jgi:putative ABC transport system permease protein
LKLDKEQPATNIKTLNEFFSLSTAQQRFSVVLLGVFAAVALLLAAVGIYGVLSYAVTQRTHEIGIRMALGAGRGDVLRLVVGKGMLLSAIGVVGGLAAAFGSDSFDGHLLFGVTATDAAFCQRGERSNSSLRFGLLRPARRARRSIRWC